MTLEVIGEWEETWAEQLYKRDYENLPDFMIDALFEYFEDGGTADEFNKTYKFGSNNIDTETVEELVKEEYRQFSS